ncbi:hypothetical protein STEG23_030204, partial [Scotinomys teguina]
MPYTPVSTTLESSDSIPPLAALEHFSDSPTEALPYPTMQKCLSVRMASYDPHE